MAQIEALERLSGQLQEAVERETGKATTGDASSGEVDKLTAAMFNTANDSWR